MAFLWMFLGLNSLFCVHRQGFQFCARPHGAWEPVVDSMHRPRPNISVLIHFVRSISTVLLRHLGLEDLLVCGIDLSGLGFTPP